MREFAGPYALTLGMIPDPPLVGEATLILEVADADSGERLPNARVVATLDPPQDSGIAPISLAFGPDSYDPTLYEANARQDATGEWTLAVEVSGGRGEGGAAFRYEVRRANPVAGLITLATLLALVTVLGLSMRAFLKRRGGSRRAKRRGKA